MIKIHHLENSRSQRVLWFLEELSMAYDVVVTKRDPKTSLGPLSQKENHPLGKWPLIEDEEVFLAESGAIVEYLAAKYGAGRFAIKFGEPGYTDYMHWLHFAESSLQPLLLMELVFSRLPGAAPFFAKPILKKASSRVSATFSRPRIADQLSLANEHLSSRAWFAGERLTGADVMMSFPLETIVARLPGIAEAYPHIATYVSRIHTRPAYLKALERGGPYAYGPKM